MKTATDPRHILRQKAIQELFEWSFRKQKPKEAVVRNVIQEQKIVDEKIARCAPQWPLEQISRIDLAVLRLAIYEILFTKQTPKKVAIDEAVELAKEFGGETSSKFINGVLGTVVKSLKE